MGEEGGRKRRRGEKGEGNGSQCLLSHCEKVLVGNPSIGLRAEFDPDDVMLIRPTERTFGGRDAGQSRGGRTLSDPQPVGFWGSIPEVLPVSYRATVMLPKSLRSKPVVQGCTHSTREAGVGQLRTGQQPGIHEKILNTHNVCV